MGQERVYKSQLVRVGYLCRQQVATKRCGGACLFPRWLLVSLMPCNITRDIVLNERRRKTFVILLHMYVDFNECKAVHVLPVFPT
jgi:hypothetical protein